MADPKQGRDTTDKTEPRREDEGTRRETERKGEANPASHKKGDTGTSRESRQM